MSVRHAGQMAAAQLVGLKTKNSAAQNDTPLRRPN